MKYTFTLVFVLSICAVFGQQKKVLFIGNSYTFYNNMPQLVYDVALSVGDSIIFDSHTPGGTRLFNHALNPAALAKISSDQWDYVVLQAQSQEPSLQMNLVANDVFPYATLLCDSIRSNNLCSRPVFYQTWGRENGDQSNCASWPPVCTYEGMDSLLQLRYQIMADDNQGYVSPVGAVWRYIRENHPTIDLYASDGSHPSPAGSFAAACTFYTIFFEKDPSLTQYNFSLTPAEANAIRNAAKVIAFDSLANWNINAFDPVSEFTFSQNINAIDFVNTSSFGEHYWWGFGDGTVSNDVNPSHIYNTTGSYQVSLIVANCGKADTSQLTVNVLVSGQQSNTRSDICVFPNPTFGELQIQGDQIEQIRLFSVSGQLLFHSNSTRQLDLTAFEAGIYLLELQLISGASFFEKVIKL